MSLVVLLLLGYSCWNKLFMAVNRYRSPKTHSSKCIWLQTRSSLLLCGGCPRGSWWPEWIIPASFVICLPAFWSFGERVLKWSDGSHSSQFNGTWQSFRPMETRTFDWVNFWMEMHKFHNYSPECGSDRAQIFGYAVVPIPTYSRYWGHSHWVNTHTLMMETVSQSHELFSLFWQF